MPRPTRGPPRSRVGFGYGALTLSGGPSQTLLLPTRFLTPHGTPLDPGLLRDRFRLLPVRSPLLGESRLLSSPRGTKMFQFPRSALDDLCIQPPMPPLPDGGFPHSDTPGSTPAYGSPGRFGVRPVLLRLPAPRHPPCAFPTFSRCVAFQFSRNDEGASLPQNQTVRAPQPLLFALLPRKEVIQPHLPIRLPCYDFTPIIDPTFGGWLRPLGRLPHRLRVLPTLVV